MEGRLPLPDGWRRPARHGDVAVRLRGAHLLKLLEEGSRAF